MVNHSIGIHHQNTREMPRMVKHATEKCSSHRNSKQGKHSPYLRQLKWVARLVPLWVPLNHVLMCTYILTSRQITGNEQLTEFCSDIFTGQGHGGSWEHWAWDRNTQWIGHKYITSALCTHTHSHLGKI